MAADVPRPAVSVVIGVYNRAQAIARCLESLLASTFTDFELVLVEDASSDGSADVLERFRLSNPERLLQVIHNRTNRGASGARNVGIAAARGELLLFTDSDCIVAPTWIAEMVNAFSATGAAAISGTVLDKPPQNLAERAYVGSCLVTRKAPNLMESNMGLRAALGYRFDEALFGGEGDDLADRIREDGHSLGLAPAAVVHHHHPLELHTYLRMGRQQGRGHTMYWYKHGRFFGRDILAGVLASVTTPLVLLDTKLLAVPASFAAAQVAAILFNELRYKGKPAGEALRVLPVQVLYYAARIGSALWTRTRIALGLEPAIRASRAAWRAQRRASPRFTGS